MGWLLLGVKDDSSVCNARMTKEEISLGRGEMLKPAKIFLSSSIGRNSEPNRRVVSWCAARNFPKSRSHSLSNWELWRTDASDKSNRIGGARGVKTVVAATSAIAFISQPGGVALSSGPGHTNGKNASMLGK